MRLILVLVIVAALAGGGYFWWTTTPQFAVEQAKEAVKAHDLQKFAKYVDIDTTSSRMVDDFLAKPMRKTMAGSVIGEVLVTGLTNLIRPRLAGGIKHEIINFVETGNFKSSEETAPIDGADGVSLSSADEHFGFRRHALKGVKSTEVDGDVARVVLLLHNQQYDRDLTLDVNMRKVDGHWQIIELANFPQFCSELAKLQASGEGATDDPVANQQKANGI
ncbi:MAG TPA: hypothetical protein V6C81_21535 [Planktothrix sp.]|jgi:hypothetical protein